MSHRLLRDRLLDRVGDRAEAQVSVTAETNALTRFANSFIHQNVRDTSTTVELVVVDEGRVARATTRQTSDAALDALVERALKAGAALPTDETFAGLAPPAPTPELDHHDPATAGASPEVRAEIVAQFVAAGEGLRAAGYCDTIERQSAFGNTAGQSSDGSVTRAAIDGIQQTPASAGKGHQASIAVADLDGSAAGSLAASKAHASHEAFDLNPGRYEVVLEPNAVGTIVMFLGFYGFNGQAVAEQRSFANLGETPFDQAISLCNDGTRPQAIAMPFDGEGTPVQRTDLIESGTIVGHTHDRRTAARVGAVSSGNAIAGGNRRYGPIPFNLFMDPGNTAREDMIASVERGLLVTEFNYCRVLDPRTVGMTGLTRNGTFMIENGVITGAVTNLRFTQSVVEALAAGNVLGVESTARLADSEFGVGFTHVPSLHLAEWNFTGGAAG